MLLSLSYWYVFAFVTKIRHKLRRVSLFSVVRAAIKKVAAPPCLLSISSLTVAASCVVAAGVAPWPSRDAYVAVISLLLK